MKGVGTGALARAGERSSPPDPWHRKRFFIGRPADGAAVPWFLRITFFECHPERARIERSETSASRRTLRFSLPERPTCPWKPGELACSNTSELATKKAALWAALSART